MESSKRLVPVVMMSVTAPASSALPVQASQPQPLTAQYQQATVPVLLVPAVPATSTEPEQLIQYRITKGIDGGFKVRSDGKWPLGL